MANTYRNEQEEDSELLVKASNNKKKNARPKPLLPQVMRTRCSYDKELQLVTKGGIIDISGEFWTTEKLVDRLFYTLAKKEAVPEIVTVPFSSNCTDNIDLLEEYESSRTFLYRKYIIRAEKFAGEYRNDKAINFVINLLDLEERLQVELLDLQRTKSSRDTLSHVLHSAVTRIFALASLAWFYESAAEEIRVILEP